MNEKMSDEFKRKLEAYEHGHLEGRELAEFEEELEKLEQFQEHLEGDNLEYQIPISGEKQKKILRKSKWKARLQTAMVAVGIFIIVMIVSTIFTAVYYSWGNPDRSEVLANVIDHTIAVTDPYGGFGNTSTNAKPFFRAEMTRDLNKIVGKEHTTVGELKVNFLFSLMSFPEWNYMGKVSQNQPAFIYPGYGDREMSEWDKLEKLPEGTVVSAYLSFNELVETTEVFNRFGEKDLNIVWLAVDTGVEGKDDWDHGVVFDPIGFSEYPIWHDDDMILDSREETKGFLFGKIISEGHSSPSYTIGDDEVLHTQFLKTLKFLGKHEKLAEKLYGGQDLNLHERIEFLEKNGINHYGIVVTGPTKEILKLKEENLISSMVVDEVDLWNW
ncbi:anti-sigma factor [Lederbergia lenta]|uniref:anti-sigma factor n=1 Tax=Lederbergia lenta TaxID=1467 RepID=UPI00203CB273|nr:anti-sigma factor [Lederbergia lenta]